MNRAISASGSATCAKACVHRDRRGDIRTENRRERRGGPARRGDRQRSNSSKGWRVASTRDTQAAQRRAGQKQRLSSRGPREGT
jgi:hypothetical protein